MTSQWAILVTVTCVIIMYYGPCVNNLSLQFLDVNVKVNEQDVDT